MKRTFVLIAIFVTFNDGSAQNCQDIWLSLKNDPTTTMVVNWRTGVSGNSVVKYGKTTALGLIDSTNENVYFHHVELTGLERGQRYFYTVTTTGYDSSDMRWFRTHDGGKRDKFLALADLHHADTLAITVSKILERNHHKGLSGVLGIGDLVHTGDINDNWINLFTVMDTILSYTPIFPTIGNHEFNNSDDSCNTYKNYFDVPENGHRDWYYYFDFPNVRLISICRAIWYHLPRSGNDVAQLNFIINKLQNSPKIITFPMYHIPTIDARQWDLNTDAENIYFDDLFEGSGVSLVITGHYHWHSRSKRNVVTYVNVGHSAHYWHNISEYLPYQYNQFGQGTTARNGKGYNIIEIVDGVITEKAYDLDNAAAIDNISIIIRHSSIKNLGE